MKTKPNFIKHCDELSTDKSFSYPNDTETFGTGAPLASLLGLEKLAINYEILKPGKRSSWPHAHKVEEEFIFILSGTPDIWINGNLYELKPGDCVGLPSGTGVAHTLINNSTKLVKALVVGEQNVPEDKIYYPMHPKRNQECKKNDFYWEDHPKHEFGTESGIPKTAKEDSQS